MSAPEVVLLSISVFVYIELSIFTSSYMYIKAAGKGEKETEKKQMLGYSIIAGVFFPITFAIIAAYKAAERK